MHTVHYCFIAVAGHCMRIKFTTVAITVASPYVRLLLQAMPHMGALWIFFVLSVSYTVYDVSQHCSLYVCKYVPVVGGVSCGSRIDTYTCGSRIDT
jgi:hypothetical protein